MCGFVVVAVNLLFLVYSSDVLACMRLTCANKLYTYFLTLRKVAIRQTVR